MHVAVGQKAYGLKGHFDVVHSLMVVKTAFGKEGDDKLGERVREQRGETQVGGRRHRGDTTLESDRRRSAAPASEQCHLGQRQRRPGPADLTC